MLIVSKMGMVTSQYRISDDDSMKNHEELGSYAISIQNRYLPAFHFILDQSTKDKHHRVGL
jgi:hypothetical protein